MRVLVVEDEAALRDSLQERLAAAGFSVDVASDGNEGLFAGLEYPLDVAVIDLGLPNLPGLEVIRRLRAARKTYPILILTARDNWQDKVEGLQAGADDYVAKPFHFEEVLARLQAPRCTADRALAQSAAARFGLRTAGVVLRRDDAGARHRFPGALGALAARAARLADGGADCGSRAATQRRLRPGPAYARSTAGDPALGAVRGDPLAALPVALAFDGGPFHQRFRRAARARGAQPRVRGFRSRPRGHREPRDPVRGRPERQAHDHLQRRRQPQPL